MRLVAITLFFSLMLSACGQKGPLYLPDDASPKPPTVQPQNTQPDPANPPK